MADGNNETQEQQNSGQNGTTKKGEIEPKFVNQMFGFYEQHKKQKGKKGSKPSGSKKKEKEEEDVDNNASSNDVTSIKSSTNEEQTPTQSVDKDKGATPEGEGADKEQGKNSNKRSWFKKMQVLKATQNSAFNRRNSQEIETHDLKAETKSEEKPAPSSTATSTTTNEQPTKSEEKTISNGDVKEDIEEKQPNSTSHATSPSTSSSVATNISLPSPTFSFGPRPTSSPSISPKSSPSNSLRSSPMVSPKPKELQLDEDSPKPKSKVSFMDESSLQEKYLHQIEELRNELNKSKEENRLILQESIRKMDEEKYRQQITNTTVVQNRNRDTLYELAQLQTRLEKEQAAKVMLQNYVKGLEADLEEMRKKLPGKKYKNFVMAQLGLWVVIFFLCLWILITNRTPKYHVQFTH